MFSAVVLVFWTLMCQCSASQSAQHTTRQTKDLNPHPLLTQAKFLPFQTTPSESIQSKENSSPPEEIPGNQPVSFVPNVFLANTDYENGNLSTRIFGPRGFSFTGNNGTAPAILRLNGFEIPMQEIFAQQNINTMTSGLMPSNSQPIILDQAESLSDEENIFLGPRNLSLNDFANPKSTFDSDARNSALNALPLQGNDQLKNLAPLNASSHIVSGLQLQGIKDQTKEHSPKKDVEVFAPLAPPEGSPQPPPGPMPPMYPQLPYYPDTGMFPNYEPSPYNPGGGDNPLYPSFYPEDPQFIPNTIQPPTLPTEEVTRATEETTRQTEETTHPSSATTHKITKPTFPTPSSTTRPVVVNTPFVPKYTPFVPKYTPYVPRNIPFLPRNTPYVPKHVPYTYATQSTRYFNMYPPTSKMPKVPPPIWPSLTSRSPANVPAQPVTPYAAKLVSAASSSPTSPSVEVIGEPADIEPKYKLAVVSDYQNYNHMDGSFGFSIDLENGLTAKVRGYKKNGKHVIEGSYSLFANEGEPVNITYVADTDNEDSRIVTEEQENTGISNTDAEDIATKIEKPNST